MAEPTPNRRNGDPTTNVFELVAAESRHQSEMRVAETRRQDDLRGKQEHCDHEIAEIHLKAQADIDALESKMRDALALAEQRRLDANRTQDVANTALALERAGVQAATLAAAVVSSADALRLAAEATKNAQDKRLQELERTRDSIGGRDVQRSEQRQQSNFSISQWITVGGILLIVAVDLHRNGVI
jgi:hypothetical protein